MKRLPAETRFWINLDMSGGPDACWPWLAGKLSGKYGALKIKGKWKLAHRFSYELMVGPIPAGYEVHHKCQTKACANFRHLEALPPQDHKVYTGAHVRATRTHCKNGHLLDEANTYVHPKRPLYKQCRTCRKENKTRFQTN